MREYMAVVERDPETGVYVGYVPGFPGAHSQGVTLDELNKNLKEVIEMLLEAGNRNLRGSLSAPSGSRSARNGQATRLERALGGSDS
jgi:predicted RNase H-like HicB family nuclease